MLYKVLTFVVIKSFEVLYIYNAISFTAVS